MKRKLYLSGPMTGLPEYNRKSFDDAEKQLAGKGHEVINPFNLPEPVVPMDATEAETWAAYLVRDFLVLHEEKPDCIILLPGWNNSKGSSIEARYAWDVLNIPSKTLGAFLAGEYGFPWPRKKVDA